jgi:hypothetical protein
MQEGWKDSGHSALLHSTSSQALRTHLNKINSLLKWVQYRPAQRRNKFTNDPKDHHKSNNCIEHLKPYIKHGSAVQVTAY